MKKKPTLSFPIPKGEYSNFVGLKATKKELVLDFAFVEPTLKGEQPPGVLIQRIILPVEVAESLAKIILNALKKKYAKTKTKATKK